MAVESPETSTTTTPIVETEQLETVVNCFSPPACPEYQTTSMATKTNWPGYQSHLSTKRTGRQNTLVEDLSSSPTGKESRKHTGKTTRPETQMIGEIARTWLRQEAKAGAGLGYNPDASEVIVWRTFGGIWPTTQAGDCGPIQDMTGMHSLQTQTSGEERPETTSDQGTRPCPHSRRSSDELWQFTDETQPTTFVQTGGGWDNKNSEHCSPLSPSGHSAEDFSASVRQC